MSPNHVIVFFSLIVFSIGGLSVLEMRCFQLSVGVKESLVESQQMSSFPFMFLSLWFHVVFISLHVPFILHYFPFMFLSCSFNFASSFNVPFIFLSWHSCPFVFRRYVSNIQVFDFERWYIQTIRSNARVFIICRYRFCYRVAIVLEACAGCHLQGSWTCTCISSLSFFFLLSFSGPLMHW
jgi:hypothetical protein